jgi:hypothetical protein
MWRRNNHETATADQECVDHFAQKLEIATVLVTPNTMADDGVVKKFWVTTRPIEEALQWSWSISKNGGLESAGLAREAHCFR